MELDFENDKEVKVGKAMKHALEIRECLALHNYFKFFKLHLTTPNEGNYLLDKLVPKVRVGALQIILKAYKPTLVPLEFVKDQLSFLSISETLLFLKQSNVVIVCENNVDCIDTKQCK